MPGEALQLILLAIGKWLTYLGLLSFIGACAFKLVAASAVSDRSDRDAFTEQLARRLVRHLAIAAGILVLAAFLRLYAQTYSAFGLDEPITGQLMRLVALETRWGPRWFAQLTAVIGAGAAVLIVLARARVGWWSAGAAAIGLAATLPLTGHALAHPGGAAWPLLLQTVHLLAAGIWLGCLLAIVVTGLPAAQAGSGEGDGQQVSAWVGVFSPVALVAVPTLIVTGLLTSFLYVGEFSQLWQTAYGRTLLAKGGLFATTAAVGAYNWRRVKPTLAAPGGTTRLRRAGRIELLLGAVVLAVTALLVHLPMPHE